MFRIASWLFSRFVFTDVAWVIHSVKCISRSRASNEVVFFVFFFFFEGGSFAMPALSLSFVSSRQFFFFLCFVYKQKYRIGPGDFGSQMAHLPDKVICHLLICILYRCYLKPKSNLGSSLIICLGYRCSVSFVFCVCVIYCCYWSLIRAFYSVIIVSWTKDTYIYIYHPHLLSYCVLGFCCHAFVRPAMLDKKKLRSWFLTSCCAFYVSFHFFYWKFDLQITCSHFFLCS